MRGVEDRKDEKVLMAQYGGFTAVAEALNARFPFADTFTRQRIWTWWHRRNRNGFPDRKPVTGKDGRTRQLFSIEEVAGWWKSYSPARGGRPRTEGK